MIIDSQIHCQEFLDFDEGGEVLSGVDKAIFEEKEGENKTGS